MTVRPVPLTVGVLALVAGTALAFGIGPTASSTATAIAFVIVVVVGALLAAVVALGRVAEGPRSDPLPEPGRGGDVMVPGDAVDEALAGIASATEDDRGQLEARIERAAIATLASNGDATQAEVRQWLADGNWTADGRAAAFLAEDAPTPSTGERLRTVVSGTSTTQRRAERAIAAIHRRGGNE